MSLVHDELDILDTGEHVITQSVVFDVEEEDDEKEESCSSQEHLSESVLLGEFVFVDHLRTRDLHRFVAQSPLAMGAWDLPIPAGNAVELYTALDLSHLVVRVEAHQEFFGALRHVSHLAWPVLNPAVADITLVVQFVALARLPEDLFLELRAVVAERVDLATHCPFLLAQETAVVGVYVPEFVVAVLVGRNVLAFALGLHVGAEVNRDDDTLVFRVFPVDQEGPGTIVLLGDDIRDGDESIGED